MTGSGSSRGIVPPASVAASRADVPILGGGIGGLTEEPETPIGGALTGVVIGARGTDTDRVCICIGAAEMIHHRARLENFTVHRYPIAMKLTLPRSGPPCRGAALHQPQRGSPLAAYRLGLVVTL